MTSDEHLALQDVGRAETEVQALVGVVRELLGRVGRRELHHAGAGDLVDHARPTRRSRRRRRWRRRSPRAGGRPSGRRCRWWCRRSRPATSTTSAARSRRPSLMSGDRQLRRRRSRVVRGTRGCRSPAAACRSSARRRRRGSTVDRVDVGMSTNSSLASTVLKRLELGVEAVVVAVDLHGVASRRAAHRCRTCRRARRRRRSRCRCRPRSA